MPFVIPESWCWVEMSDIFLLNPKNDINDNVDGGFIPMACVCDGYSGEHTFITKQWGDIKKGFSHFQNGDIGIAKISPCFENRKSVIFSDLPNNIGSGTTELVVLRGIIVNTAFYLLLIKSDWYISEGTKYFKGVVGQQRVHKDIFTTLQVPMPPLREQQKIVDSVKKWFSAIDEIENGATELETVIKQVKSKILDLAVSGKLVPQDPNDEPAIELLKRINPAFEPCDNSHYGNLPQGWAVCRLEDILDYEQPQAYIVNSTDYSDEYETPVLTAGKSFIIGYTNETNGICDRLPVIIFDDFTTDSKLVDFPFKVKSSAMKILRTKGEININYIAYYMSITRLIGDTHKRYWISEYSKLLIPIPPYQEQLRIVETVETIFNEILKITAESS